MIIFYICTKIENIMIKYLCIIYCAALIGQSCKQEKKIGLSTSTVVGDNNKTSKNPGDNLLLEDLNKLDTVKTLDIEKMRGAALAFIEFRREKGNNPQASLDVGAWGYDGIFQGGKFLPLSEVTGKWIDFSEKWTYEYGDSSGKKGSGIYHYSMDDKILLMLDNNPKIKPYEYEVKIINAVMLLMGKSTYEDGNYQAKLGKLEKAPTNK
jgi:hypothetical protein